MDLIKLFETQKILRDRINYNEPDRFNKLVLALLVELGECANEWRGFKFWSKNQEPRRIIETEICKRCNGLGFLEDEGNISCPVSNCLDGEIVKYPLLEEYVDGLHFVLELGLEFGWTPIICDLYLKAKNVNIHFIALYKRISLFSVTKSKSDYYKIVELYCGLSKMLGFDWEEVKQAYYAKNEINHQRQEEGY